MTSDKRYNGLVKRVTIKETYDGHTQQTYRIYDRAGKLIEYTAEDGKYLLEYNSKGQCIRETWYMGLQIACVWENTYDQHGNLTLSTSIANGELITKTERGYNSKGQKIRVKRKFRCIC